MGLYDFSYLKRNGKYLTRNNKILYTYARGLYSIEEIDALIADGFIPVATATELDGLRHSSQRVMGSGTPWEDLYFTGLGGSYVQVGNIDLSIFDNWQPFGELTGAATKWTGKYKGNELVISNMTWDRLQGGGLIEIAQGAECELSDIRIVNVLIGETIEVGNRGALAGVLEDNAVMDNCIAENVSINPNYVSGTGSGIGGLVGTVRTGAKINNSYTKNANIRGSAEIGGLVGSLLAGSEIKNSGADAFSGYKIGDYLGGFVGRSAGLIEDSYASNVTLVCERAGNSVTGGFLGSNDAGGSVRRSWATGTSTSIRGFNAGFVSLAQTGAGAIENCWADVDVVATGTAAQTANCAGFISRNRAPLINSYSVGNVSAASTTNKGGFCGANENTITNSYYDSQTSGQSDPDKGEPRTTAQLQQGTADSFILPAGGTDPDNLPANAVYTSWSNAIWNFLTNIQYPKLR